MGMILTNNSSAKSGSDGSVFIVNVEPLSAGCKVVKKYVEGTVPENNIVESIQTNDLLVKVSVYVDSMSAFWSPTVKINNNVAHLIQVINNNRLWFGEAYISLLSVNEIKAETSDGAFHSINVETFFEGPQIISAILGPNPKLNNDDASPRQTELKEGDFVTITGTASEKCFISIVDFGIFGNNIGVIETDDDGRFTITGLVSNRQGTFKSKIVAINDFGTFGSQYEINDERILNQNGVEFNLINVNYPAGQSALKNNEIANVTLQILNLSSSDEIEYYSDLTEQLTISNRLSYELNKTVIRLHGDEAVNDNFNVVVRKQSNGKISRFSTKIDIYNIPLTATLSTQRLKSSPDGELHNVNIECSQPVISANMTLSNGSQIISKSINNKTISLIIRVKDTDTKGLFGFENITIMNPSRIITDVINNNELIFAGFTKRTIQVAAWPNRTALIGVAIYDSNNLRCSNLSKDESDSYNFNFKLTKDNETNKYTIVDINNNINIAGGYFYNCDLENSISNTTGLMYIEIEEI